MADVPQPAPDYSVPIPAEYPLCTCFMVTEREIEQAIRAHNLTTIKQIMEKTHAGCGCHSCHPDLDEILARCLRGEFKFAAPAAGSLPPVPVVVNIPPVKS